MDGDVDCSAMNDEQLEAALRSTDPHASPLDHEKLKAEQARRQASAAPAPAATIYRPEFRAEGREYFRIWIVNLVLSLLTLGIYSAWAKVRKQRYLYGSTSVAGSAFGYHADPRKILRGRLIAAAIFGLYFAATRYAVWTTLLALAMIGVVWPWLVVRSRMFALRMTSWRGLRFSFDRDYAGAYWVLLVWTALGVFSLGTLFPRAIWERYRYIVSRSHFGQSAFSCAPRLLRFYGTAAALIGIFLIWMVAIMMVVGLVTMLAKAGGISKGHVKTAMMVAMLAVYLMLFVVVRAYSQSRNLNEVLGTSSVGTMRVHCRLSAMRLLGLYLSNTLGIVITLGMYIPWAEVRLIRYRMDCLSFELAGSAEQFIAASSGSTAGPVGEEISEFFDLDFGL